MFAALKPDVKQKLLSNIFIMGGNSLVPGFDERIRHELRMMTPSHMPVNIVNSYNPARQIKPWQGAAKLSSQPKIYMSKKDYDECGSHYL